MHKTAIDFVIASLIGAAVFVIVGYFAQGNGVSIGYWLSRSPQPGPWALLGVFVGSGLRYLRH